MSPHVLSLFLDEVDNAYVLQEVPKRYEDFFLEKFMCTLE